MPAVDPAELAAQLNEAVGGDRSADAQFTTAGRCPAFASGCPYKDNSELNLNECPAFQSKGDDGTDAIMPICPFSKAAGVGDIGEAMAKMPASHTAEGTKAYQVLVESLKVMHNSQAASHHHTGEGRSCPLFDRGCPFKLQCMTSSGLPLALAIEAKSWFAENMPMSVNDDAGFTESTQDLETPEASAEVAKEEGINGDISQSQQATDMAPDILLSKMLKVGTQAAHKEAESGAFVKRLLRGKSSPKEYRNLLVDLYYVYCALEESLDRAVSVFDHRIVKSIHYPRELNRCDALRRDLQYWFDRDVAGGSFGSAQPSQPAQEYAARMRELATEEGRCHLLVAHAYTRYLGDLSGGQLLKRSICRAMPVGADGAGVEFYEFEHVPDAKEFKRRYRDELDDLDVPAELADEIVEEANKAFNFNAAIFAHLDAMAGIVPSAPAHSKPSQPEIPAGHPALPAGKDANLANCPFATLASQVRAEERAEAAAARTQRSTTTSDQRSTLGPKRSTSSKCAAALVGMVVLFGPVVAAVAVYAMGS